jgi:asparagine synthetase B (glutamine-hydrolysing)
MMDEVLVKVDRASMYAALETRAPFLDRQVVEYANRLPYMLKLHGNTTKYVLKKTMEGKLPQHIIDRTKKGFGIPIGAWLRGDLKGWAEGLLFPQGELLGGLKKMKLRDFGMNTSLGGVITAKNSGISSFYSSGRSDFYDCHLVVS